MSKEVELNRHVGHRAAAYEMGRDLARRSNEAAKELIPSDMGGAFDHPFFRQGQTKREVKHTRSVHVINDHEYILTEETTTTELLSFGDDIFK